MAILSNGKIYNTKEIAVKQSYKTVVLQCKDEDEYINLEYFCKDFQKIMRKLEYPSYGVFAVIEANKFEAFVKTMARIYIKFCSLL